ncbi:hypothetical protein AcV5_001333 [Taiwanofungus camphoratus]|nr:hypothetical protein AcV5_001333 [Antrodia cinnamomea]
MLEPLAATVFNSLLSGRPLIGHCSTSQPVLRMVSRATSSAFPQDFFTPYPRRSKGKERALPDEECGVCRDVPRPGLSSFSSSCMDTSQFAMLRDVTSLCQRGRRLPSRRWMDASGRSDLPSRREWTGKADVLQRRHASSVPDPLSAPSSSPAVTQQDQWRNLIATFSSKAKSLDPEDVWGAYQSLRHSDGCADMEVLKLLNFGNRIAAIAGEVYTENGSLESIRLWGTRLQDLLRDIAPRLEDNPLHETHVRWRCLMVRGLAMAGDFDKAFVGANELKVMPMKQHIRIFVIQMYTTLILSLRRHHHPMAVLEFLVREWNTVGTYLVTMVWPGDDLSRCARTFRRFAYEIVACIEKPVGFMLDIQKLWSLEQRQLAGKFLIDVLCVEGMASDALDVLEVMHKQSLSVNIELQLKVVKALVKADSFELANTLFASLSQWTTSGLPFKNYQLLGLYLFAHQGDVPRAEEYFERLAQREWVTAAEKHLLLHAHAVNGNAHRTVELFHHFFPDSSPDRPPTDPPNIYHYSAVIFAFAQRSDFNGINVWLEKMLHAGIRPDIYVYTSILHSFAMRGEVQYIATLLQQMRTAGIPPTRESYTTVLTLLAHRKDPIAAEEIYKRAIGEGIIPDRRMITALMHAFVEAGEWKGVIRAFDYMKSSTHRGIRLSIEVYNTLLKAYVLIGAPFRVVANLFQKLDSAKVRPDAYTFALLIQSACDSGLMEIASDLFAEMERLAESWQSSLHINVYVLTILMIGYLRKGHRGRAKAVFDDMKKRGLQPTAITYGAIVKAYGTEKTGAGLQVAEEFIRSLVAADPSQRPWMKPIGGRGLALETIYAPLMSAYTRRLRPDRVELLFQEMLDAGGEPTIGTLTALLDAHRRTSNVEAARKIWPQIYELGLRHAQVNSLFTAVDEETQPNLRGHDIVMCIPLSIYIDVLSKTGHHLEIAQVWNMLKTAGLAFDSHNWNHLAVALVRAGNLERACEVIEKVILPYKRKLQSISITRDEKPDSPLSMQSAESIDLPPAPPESPLHTRDRRVSSVNVATKRSKPTMEEARPEDFAHPLHILRQISPLWRIWRPHEVTLRVLGDALHHLESGRLIQPIRPGADIDFEQAATDVKTLRQRRTLSGEILSRIYNNYPETVQLLRQFELVKRPRLERFKYKRS